MSALDWWDWWAVYFFFMQSDSSVVLQANKIPLLGKAIWAGPASHSRSHSRSQSTEADTMLRAITL
jgi:hypothetical protein